MSIRKAIENNIAVSLFTVAVAAFGAGWFSYSAVQHASKLEAIPEYSLRELEKRASLGKEELNAEIELLRGHIDNLNEHIALLRIVILKNQTSDVLKISNVRLNPPTPRKLKVGDAITVTFSYKVSAGEKVNLFVGSGKSVTGEQSSALQEVTGSGEATLRLTPLSPGQVDQIVISRTLTPTEIEQMAQWAPELLVKGGHKIPASAKFANTIMASYLMYVDYNVTKSK